MDNNLIINSYCNTCNKCSYVKDLNYELNLSYLDNYKLDTTSKSYFLFLKESSKYKMFLNNIIHNTLLDLYSSNINFDVDMYYKLDKIFLLWLNWYDKILLYLRTLLIEEKKCDNFNFILKDSIEYFYKSNLNNCILPFKDKIYNFLIDFSQSIPIPVTNGDFAETAKYIGEEIIKYFKLVIIQYAQYFIIKNKINIFYYSSLYNDFNLNDEIFIFYSNAIKEYSNAIVINVFDNLNLNNIKVFEKYLDVYIRKIFNDIKINNK